MLSIRDVKIEKVTAPARDLLTHANKSLCTVCLQGTVVIAQNLV